MSHTDTKVYNDFGNDSSGSSSAQSPLSQRGGSESVQSLGDVKTDFDPIPVGSASATDDDK